MKGDGNVKAKDDHTWPIQGATMIHQPLYFYGALFLLCLLTLRGLYSLILRVAKERSMTIDAQKRLMEKGRKANRLTKAAIFGMFCFGGGWLGHDLQQFHHTYVLNDLQVIQKHGDLRFTFAFYNGQTFTTTFCNTYVPQFDVGMTLKVLVYEDKGTCWNISNKKLGYILTRNEDGRVTIKGE